MKNQFSFFLFLVVFCVRSQTPFERELIASFQKNSILQEKVFVHTNKTSYFIDDVIWFKAYIGNADNTPSLRTTELIVNLMGPDGECIFSKNVFIFKGTGKGQFELNTTIMPGRYYLQAYTKNSRNFEDDFIYLQEINVLGKPDDGIAQKEELLYDVQVFPEGGYLLENVNNTIGIKSTLNGQSVDFTGTIVNSKNEQVTQFISEHLGMTKCDFYYRTGEHYTALVHMNDTLIKVAVPHVKETGVSLGIGHAKDTLEVSLKTNKKSLQEPGGLQYTLLAHQRNTITTVLNVKMIDSVNTKILLPKSIFPQGVNTLTLFWNNHPIAERKFYIEHSKYSIAAKIKKIRSELDSSVYEIKLDNTKFSAKADLSISVLPSGAKNYVEEQNIKTAFLLKPYVKGHIENPAYYFNKTYKKRKEHLDLLLLTQGWSKYNLDEMIKALNPRKKYDFTLGHKIKGRIIGPILHSRLALISNDNELIDKIPLNVNKNFVFDRLLIYRGDTVKLSYLNKSNEVFKINKFQIDSPNQKEHPILKIQKKHTSKPLKKEKAEEDTDVPWYTTGTIALDEVLLTGKRRSEAFLRRRMVNNKLRTVVRDIGKYYEIPLPKEYKDHNDDLISYLNFNEAVRLVLYKGMEYYLEVGYKKEALLFIDGRRIESAELGALNLSMEHVEHLMVQPVGRGNRIYQVFTTENYQKNIVELFNEHIVLNGYDRPKAYYSPMYQFDNQQYADWMEIDWKPAIRTNENGKAFFKIKKGNTQNGYLFSIQGFTNEGWLISEVLQD